MAIGEVGGGRGSPELGLPQPRAVWEEALHGLRSHRESHCSPRLHSCVCACHGPGARVFSSCFPSSSVHRPAVGKACFSHSITNVRDSSSPEVGRSDLLMGPMLVSPALVLLVGSAWHSHPSPQEWLDTHLHPQRNEYWIDN